jgi:hypothetical protein
VLNKGGDAMNEQLKHAIEAMNQLSESAQSVLAERILKEIEEIEEQERETSVNQPQGQQIPCKTEEASPVARPLTRQEFLEKLYREGKILNIPTREPLTEEEEARRTRLAQATAGGKPVSEIVIEGRGPY